jgi:hypothetical protein
MVVTQLVVAVGQHQHAGQVGDPPGEVADHVEGGVVGPVHVLDDHHRRPVGELLVGGTEDRVPLRRDVHDRVQRSVGDACHVSERPERARRHQVVAHPDQHASAIPCLLGERPDQTRLADSGLAVHQHDRTKTPTSLAQHRPQLAELGVTLEQPPLHDRD